MTVTISGKNNLAKKRSGILDKSGKFSSMVCCDCMKECFIGTFPHTIAFAIPAMGDWLR